MTAGLSGRPPRDRTKGLAGVRQLAGYWWDRVAAEATKFGFIGLIGVFVDNGAYAFFQYGWFGPVNGPLYGHEKLGSFAATAVATVFSWVCNRFWTWRDQRPDNVWREAALFAGFNAVGALITMACIVVAIDVLHLSGLAWESAARNVGIVLGTLFRFWSYRTYVFPRRVPRGPRPRGRAGRPRYPRG